MTLNGAAVTVITIIFIVLLGFGLFKMVERRDQLWADCQNAGGNPVQGEGVVPQCWADDGRTRIFP